MSADRIDVLAVMESCRDRDGLLNDTGRLLAHDLRMERVWRGINDNVADDFRAAAESLAFNTKAAADSLRGACAVPVTANRRPFRRRSGIVGGGK